MPSIVNPRQWPAALVGVKLPSYVPSPRSTRATGTSSVGIEYTERGDDGAEGESVGASFGESGNGGDGGCSDGGSSGEPSGEDGTRDEGRG